MWWGGVQRRGWVREWQKDHWLVGQRLFQGRVWTMVADCTEYWNTDCWSFSQIVKHVNCCCERLVAMRQVARGTYLFLQEKTTASMLVPITRPSAIPTITANATPAATETEVHVTMETGSDARKPLRRWSCVSAPTYMLHSDYTQCTPGEYPCVISEYTPEYRSEHTPSCRKFFLFLVAVLESRPRPVQLL